MDELPSTIMLTVRDAASGRVLSVSAATPVHVNAPPRGGRSDGDGKDSGKDGASDGSPAGAAPKQGGSS